MNTKILIGVLFVISIGLIDAHTVLTGISINGGASQTTCLKPQYPGNLWAQTKMGAQWPIESSTFLTNGIASANYTCGFLPYAAQAAASKCAVTAGQQVSVSYFHGANADEDPAKDRFIAYSHKGPFLAYLAKSDTGSGNVWFKIYQQGKVAESTNFNNVKWASADTLLANNGQFTFTIPNDITPGNYLLRTEIIALHDTSAHGAQPYVHCVELTVNGGGASNPAGVSIPGSWTWEHPGMRYNIYNQFTQAYPFPGPAVYVAGSNPTPVTTQARPPVTTGAKPVPVTTGNFRPVTTSPLNVPSGTYTINVVVTALLNVKPSTFDVTQFTNELVSVTAIPPDAIKQIVLDMDQSTTTKTKVIFTIYNFKKADGSYVDPVAVANTLKQLVATQSAKLRDSEYLRDMEIESVDEPTVGSADKSTSFVNTAGFIAIVVVGGAILIVLLVLITIVVIRRRSH